MELEEKLEHLSDKIDLVSQKVDKMYHLMIGHELDQDSGYVSKMKLLENQVKDLIEFKKKIIWIGFGMSIPTGLGVFKMIEFFIKLIQ